jgi:hypothetical protein
MDGGGGLLTVMVNWVAGEEWPDVSVAVRVKTTLAFDAGVPETIPVAGFSERLLEGRPTALHVSVPVPAA